MRAWVVDACWVLGAIVGIALAGGVRALVLQDAGSTAAQFQLYTLVVVLVAFGGGLVPGLVAVGGGVLLSALHLFEGGTLQPLDHASQLMFVVVGVAVSALGAAHLRARGSAGRGMQELERQRDELERLNQELAVSEARFRGTFEQAAVGMAHTALDGTWLLVNQKFAHLLGYAGPQEMVGKLVTEVTPPEELRADLESARHLIGGEAETVTREKRYLRRDGAEFWGSLTLSLLREPTGDARAFVAVVQDITQQRGATAALAERESYVRQLLDATEEGILGIDGEARVTLVNQAALDLLGFGREELIGVSVHDALRPPVQAPTPGANQVLRAVQAGESAHVVDLLWRKDGEALEVELHVHPIIGGDGAHIGAVITFSDVGARRSAEREREELLASERAARSDAERASRIKEEFVAVVSHELRTPLSAILGWVQILMRQADQLPPRLREGLTVIERNARLQAQLVSDLLDMSRIMSGRFRLEWHVFDLAEVVRRTVKSFLPQAAERGIRLSAQVADVGQMDGDPARIEQVLTNLLSNALKFTGEQGEVVVTLNRRGQDAELRVRDTGQGIEPAFLEQVFKRFRQADPSMTRSTGGLGLGLAIVKEIVERHGGTIRAESEGLGRGATFCVVVPVVQRGQRRETSAPKGVIRLDELDILVVEDNRDTREMLRALFEERGARVRAAVDVEEALRLFDDCAPDILVSDIGLPRRDGYDLIRTVRAREDAGGRIPAIALTALARNEDRQRALDAGYQEHVSKPVNLELLCELVTELAGARV